MALAAQPAQAAARFSYERHGPEETTLYHVVQQELETFLDLARTARSVSCEPGHSSGMSLSSHRARVSGPAPSRPMV
jgi:hypothetical protein